MNYITSLFLVIIFSFFGYNANATHVAGAELTYQWLSDSTYEFTYIFYRDCSGVAENDSLELCIKNTCNSFSTIITLQKTILSPNGGINGQSVSTGCPSNPTSCNGGSIIGYKEWAYSGIYTLPSRCTNWIFSLAYPNRNAAITNLVNPNSATLYTEATLNNVNSQNNSSPRFTVKPVPYVCVNQPYSFNNGTVEINGDSLVFESIQPRKNATAVCNDPITPISYSNSLFNITNPFACNSTFNCNAITGEISFTASANQVAVVAILCKEYKNGVLIGSVMRDIQMVIQNCTTPIPSQNLLTNTITGASYDSISGTISKPCFDATPITFCFTIQSNNPNAVLVPTSNNAQSLLGSIITYSGLYTDSVVGCISWLPSISDSGLNLLVLNVKDSTCGFGNQFIVTNSITIPVFIGQSINLDSLQVTTISSCSNPNSGSALATAVSSIYPITFSLLPVGTSNTNGVFNNLSVGNYTLTASDLNTCTVSTLFSIIYLNIPNFDSVFTIPNTTCLDSLGAIFLQTTGNAQPFTFLMSNGATNNTGFFTNVLPGTYTITVTNTLGCTNTTVIQLNYTKPLPPILSVYAVPNDSICFGQSITITTNGAATITYSNGISNGIAFTPISSAIYTVTGSSANGCFTSSTIAVFVRPIITPTFSTIAMQCKGAFISPLPTVSLNGIIGFWSPALNNNITTTYTFTPNVGQCAVSVTTTIIINSPVSIALSNSNTTCGNSNGSVTIGAIVGGTSPYLYSCNNSLFTNNISYLNLIAGSFSVVVKDINGCIHDTVITISNIAGPNNFTISKINATCGNNNGSFTLGAVLGGTPNYLFNINGSGFSAFGNFASLSSGTYTIIVKDSNNCEYFKIDSIINIAGPISITPTIINASCGLANGAVSIVTVIGGTNPNQFNINNGIFSNTISFTSLAIGVYTVAVKDANGCTLNTTVTIINQAGPTFLSAAVLHTICNKNNGVINITNIVGGTIPILFNINNGAFSADVNYLNLGSGNYTVTAKDKNGCTISTLVTINPSDGVADITMQVNDVTCDGQNGNIKITNVTGGVLPYEYTYNGNAPTKITYYQNLVAGIYTIVVIDASGCSLEKKVTIIKYPEFANCILNANAASCIADNGSININTILGGTLPYTYTLLPNNFKNTNGDFFNLIGNKTYTISVTDAINCNTTAFIFVPKIECCTGVIIPSAFSPNSDGINDEFAIKYADNLELKDLLIANRFGEIVFKTKNKMEIWRGDYKGGKGDVGVYFYYIQYYCPVTRENFIKKGEVTLIR